MNLERYVGKRVRVFSMSGTYTDDGVVTDLDGDFLELQKNEDTLLFPIVNIRLIKLMDAEAVSEEDRLLRPFKGGDAQ